MTGTGKTVTRVDLCEAVYQKVGLSRTESSAFVELVLKEITDCLEKGETVKLSSFGSFTVRKKKQRIGRNPKTGADIVFTSGRSGAHQVYRMNMDGADVERLTPGIGEAGNPSWNPDGHIIAFAWTRGFEPGNFNIFVMDVATKNPVQLTKGTGRNENPWWAPDGLHLVFTSKRGPSTQIYSMLADGNNVKQLTTQGNNIQPVWSKAVN